MRVITGVARGRKLVTPEGLETRPTSERAKEAIFSAIQFEIEQAMVLDLFAGSGQLGVEALSRGARFAVFVDSSAEANRCIMENLKSVGLMKQARVAQMEALSYLKTTKDKFDIVFMDPPYFSGLMEDALELCASKMNPGGIIICETDKELEIPKGAGEFVCKKEYRCGKAKFGLFRRMEEEE